METVLHKKSILKKTAQVASSTLMSKLLALIRSVYEIKYLGAGPISDAFWVAYGIPNTLRKVFAEGALSASFIPTLIKIVKDDGDDQASKLMTLMFMIIEGIVLIICFLVFFNVETFVLWYAPGFKNKPLELATAVPLLRILIFFIFFVSSSALLAGAMQAKQHFFIPAWGPLLLNIIFIAGLLCGLHYQMPIQYFAFFIICGGILLLLLHIYMYFKLNFKFLIPDTQTIKYFKQVMGKFLPCLFAMSAMEINLTIDKMLASYLPSGSISIFNYASAFLRIPLGTFAVAFSTILLSHFSRVSTYAPKRLSFYLLESAKFILWFTLPATAIMIFLSNKFFFTIFLSDNFTIFSVNESAKILSILLIGLFFFSINKMLLSVYYSLHKTLLPSLISLAGTISNTLVNIFLMPFFGILGIAIGTTVGGIFQTVLFIYFLHKKFGFKLYLKNFCSFLMRFIFQLLLVGSIFYYIYEWLLFRVPYLVPYVNSFMQPLYRFIPLLPKMQPLSDDFFINNIGFWIWTVPLSLAIFGVLYLTRKIFRIKVYFLD